MYTPRYGLGYVTQQRINAQLSTLRSADMHRRPLTSDDKAALGRMLTVLGVIAVVATGMVLAIAAAGGLQ